MPPAWTDAARRIDGKLEVQWNLADWTDESTNLISANGSQSGLPLWQLAGGTQTQPPWTASFQMRNAADRYTPTNTDGALYANIATNKGYGIPIRFSMGLWTGAAFDYTQVFQGFIDRPTITSTRDDRCSWTCVDNAHPLLQRKVTTTMYVDQRVDEWLTVLATEGGVASTDFDTGVCVVPYCWCDDENSWTEMQKAAHSEAGVLFFDRTGTLTFENVEAWAADARHNSSQATFAVTRFKDLGITFDWQNCYNEVLVEFSPRVQRGRVELYALDEAVRLLPGDTRTVTARLRYPATSIEAPTANKHYHIISTAGTDLSASVTFTTTKYAQRVELAFTNAHAYALAVVYDFKLMGRPLQGYPALQEKLQATDSDIGDPTSAAAKTFRVSGNEYIQTEYQARMLAQLLRDRLKRARQSYPVRDMPAIPTLQPGDLVTVVEADSELNNTGYIEKIVWRYQGGAYRADYQVVDSAGWYLYSDYFDLGTDLLGGDERVFY